MPTKSCSRRRRGWRRGPSPSSVPSIGLESALGDRVIPQVFIGKLIGRFAKKFALGADGPIAKNAPTSPEFLVTDERDLERERTKLLALIERFATGGPAACTKNPHAFFGALTPMEWAVLQYKHLDHHLRQFGV